MSKLSQVGKNLTTKVTADKLKKAWSKAGAPTDSNAIAAILSQAGVNGEVVNTVYKDMGIEAPKAAPATEPETGDEQDGDVEQGTGNTVDIKALADMINNGGFAELAKGYLATA